LALYPWARSEESKFTNLIKWSEYTEHFYKGGVVEQNPDELLLVLISNERLADPHRQCENSNPVYDPKDMSDQPPHLLNLFHPVPTIFHSVRNLSP
jgi:hypothetical protein